MASRLLKGKGLQLTSCRISSVVVEEEIGMDLWTSMSFCIHIYEEVKVTTMNNIVVSSNVVTASF